MAKWVRLITLAGITRSGTSMSFTHYVICLKSWPLDLITFVKDRPGHDARYAIDASKIQRELGWVPEETFETGLRKTVQWYLDNREWWQRVLSGDYKLDRIGSNT